MAKTTPEQATTTTQEQKLSLDEFCRRLSESVNRPELIGGFEFVERRAGRVKDTDAAYRQRFDLFVQTPV